MTHMRNTRQGRHVAASIVISLLVLTACGEDDSSSSGKQSAATDVPAEVEYATAETASGGETSINGGNVQAATEEASTNTVAASAEPGTQLPRQVVPPSSRDLIVVMTVGLEVTDAAAAVDKVINLAAAHGGQLYNSSLDLTDPEFAAGDLVFKMPPSKVDAFLGGLEPGIGRRTGLQGTTTDVTNQISDLDAQILTAYTSVGRVRALLDGAETLSDVIALEGELSARETRLEQLLAQQAGLKGQVALATITVHLTTAPVVEEVVALNDEKKDTSISAAFSKGWKSFVAVLVAFALLIGYSAPFLLVGGLVLLVTMRITRRRARLSQSRSAAPPHPPAPDAGPRTSSPDFVDAAKTP